MYQDSSNTFYQYNLRALHLPSIDKMVALFAITGLLSPTFNGGSLQQFVLTVDFSGGITNPPNVYATSIP
jgi:hypothetical protein